MKAGLLAANIFGWPILQLAIARFTLSLPIKIFSRESRLYKIRSWEREGKLYRNWLAVHRWKRRLPDGAAWFGGFPKKQPVGRDPAYLGRFILETRRSELTHWCMLGCFPIFFFWNPPWACAVMAVYAVAANLPFIIVQRYNRAILLRIRSRQEDRKRG